MMAKMESINDLSDVFQDYLLDILEIGKGKKIVREKDISKKRNVKMPSVTVTLKKMENAGLLIHEKYGYVELTEKGSEMAVKLEERHKKLYDFLTEILSLDPEIAEKDAHKIEHDLDETSIKKISEFMNGKI